MNNVSPINKAQRLTEAEVHAAAEELQSTGGKVSCIEIYKHLGRGSLTTITNFLKTWNQEEEKTNTLPALVSLPDSLKAVSEQLIVKLWAESQKLAESELQTQREALRQAEAIAVDKIKEAQAFSEEQAKEIEALKDQCNTLKNEAGVAHEFFMSEENKLRAELSNARKGETIFEQRLIETEKQLKKAEEKINALVKDIETLKESEKKQEIKINILEVKKEELENELKKIEERHKENVGEICKIRDKVLTPDEN